ncbi:hypothetical protein P4O66_007260, partial [Electrophorus voltai]
GIMSKEDDSLESLDSEFDHFLVDMKPYVLRRPHKSERQRCALWIKKLCDPVASGSGLRGRKNRNVYARLLLQMLRRGVLEGPFAHKPEAGTLKTLPTYMSIYFDEPLGARGLGPTTLPDWVSGELAYEDEMWSSLAKDSSSLLNAQRYDIYYQYRNSHCKRRNRFSDESPTRPLSSSPLRPRQATTEDKMDGRRRPQPNSSDDSDLEVRLNSWNLGVMCHALILGHAHSLPLPCGPRVDWCFHHSFGFKAIFSEHWCQGRHGVEMEQRWYPLLLPARRHVLLIENPRYLRQSPIALSPIYPKSGLGKNSVLPEEQVPVFNPDKEIEMRTKVLEAKHQEEKLKLQQRHDADVQKILERKNGEIEELKSLHRTKQKEADEVIRALQKKVQSLLRESQVIRQSKEEQIAELKKMADQSADSLKNDWEKKVRAPPPWRPSLSSSLQRSSLETSQGLGDAWRKVSTRSVPPQLRGGLAWEVFLASELHGILRSVTPLQASCRSPAVEFQLLARPLATVRTEGVKVGFSVRVEEGGGHGSDGVVPLFVQLHAAVTQMEQEKFELQKKHTDNIQELLEDTTQRLAKMEAEYRAQLQATVSERRCSSHLRTGSWSWPRVLFTVTTVLSGALSLVTEAQDPPFHPSPVRLFTLETTPRPKGPGARVSRMGLKQSAHCGSLIGADLPGGGGYTMAPQSQSEGATPHPNGSFEEREDKLSWALGPWGGGGRPPLTEPPSGVLAHCCLCVQEQTVRELETRVKQLSVEVENGNLLRQKVTQEKAELEIHIAAISAELQEANRRNTSLQRENSVQREQHEEALQKLEVKHDADISHFHQEHALSAVKASEVIEDLERLVSQLKLQLKDSEHRRQKQIRVSKHHAWVYASRLYNTGSTTFALLSACYRLLDPMPDLENKMQTETTDLQHHCERKVSVQALQGELDKERAEARKKASKLEDVISRAKMQAVLCSGCRARLWLPEVASLESRFGKGRPWAMPMAVRCGRSTGVTRLGRSSPQECGGRRGSDSGPPRSRGVSWFPKPGKWSIPSGLWLAAEHHGPVLKAAPRLAILPLTQAKAFKSTTRDGLAPLRCHVFDLSLLFHSSEQESPSGAAGITLLHHFPCSDPVLSPSRWAGRHCLLPTSYCMLEMQIPSVEAVMAHVSVCCDGTVLKQSWVTFLCCDGTVLKLSWLTFLCCDGTVLKLSWLTFLCCDGTVLKLSWVTFLCCDGTVLKLSWVTFLCCDGTVLKLSWVTFLCCDGTVLKLSWVTFLCCDGTVLKLSWVTFLCCDGTVLKLSWVTEREEQLSRLRDSQRQQMLQAESALDSFKKQLEISSEKAYADLKQQMERVEADLSHSKLLREKQTKEFGHQLEDLQQRYEQQGGLTQALGEVLFSLLDISLGEMQLQLKSWCQGVVLRLPLWRSLPLSPGWIHAPRGCPIHHPHSKATRRPLAGRPGRVPPYTMRHGLASKRRQPDPLHAGPPFTAGRGTGLDGPRSLSPPPITRGLGMSPGKQQLQLTAQQIVELKLQYEQERSHLFQQHNAEKDSLVQDHQREIGSLQQQTRAAMLQHQAQTQEWRKRDAQSISELEAQVQSLREEVLAAHSQRKQQLVELGVLREEERQQAAREQEAALDRLRTEMECARLDLEKIHAAERDLAQEKANSRLKQLEKEYSQKLAKSAQPTTPLGCSRLRSQAERRTTSESRWFCAHGLAETGDALCLSLTISPADWKAVVKVCRTSLSTLSVQELREQRCASLTVGGSCFSVCLRVGSSTAQAMTELQTALCSVKEESKQRQQAQQRQLEETQAHWDEERRQLSRDAERASKHFVNYDSLSHSNVLGRVHVLSEESALGVSAHSAPRRPCREGDSSSNVPKPGTSPDMLPLGELGEQREALQERVEALQRQLHAAEKLLLSRDLEFQEQITRIRQQYEMKIKGLMPVELRQELEDTITSLKSQARNTHTLKHITAIVAQPEREASGSCSPLRRQRSPTVKSLIGRSPYGEVLQWEESYGKVLQWEESYGKVLQWEESYGKVLQWEES